MDGAEALAYVRYRATPEGDIGRVERQLDVLRGLASVVEGRDLVADINTLLPMISDHVRTNLDVSDMTELARSLQGRCTSASAETAVLAGTRVRMDDAILHYPVYFNVVTEATIEERVRELLAA
jgi:anionic cell wall polymer biosynthesis LytR-Cps2A-Psr (LCP) family protein